MVGIIVQLALSWLIVWLFERGNLSVLGLMPTRRRVQDFILFFLLTAVCCSTGFLMKFYFANQHWELNPRLSLNVILTGTWWNIKSVLFEELIFRGVLLYILIKKTGPVIALIISAVAFGIYHWFSFEVIGNITQMGITFIITGTMGLLYAYGFTKTFSLYIPCAIHLGWNLTQSVIFSEGIIGDQLLVKVKPLPEVTVSYFLFFIISLFPMVSALLTNYILLKRRKQIELPI